MAQVASQVLARRPLAVKGITPTSSDEGACGGDSLKDGGLPETLVIIGVVGLI